MLPSAGRGKGMGRVMGEGVEMTATRGRPVEPAVGDELGRVEAPDGVAFRRLADDGDVDAMVAIFDAAKAVDRIEQTRTADGIRIGIRARDAANAHPDVLLAEVDGQVVGWCESWAARPGVEGIRFLEHFGFVHPDWRRRGIGRALIARSAARLVALAAPDERAELMTEADANEVATGALLERLGYRAVRYVAHMVRPSLDDPPDDALPAGLEVRPATQASAMSIVRALDEAFHDHWGWIAMTEEQMAAGLDHPLLGQLDVWQVAWDGDEVAGGVLGWIDEDENREYGRRRGYTEAIFTRRPWRGRGLATALIGRNLRLLRQRGMTEAALSVDTENLSGALALYARVGFREVGRIVVYARPLQGA